MKEPVSNSRNSLTSLLRSGSKVMILQWGCTYADLVLYQLLYCVCTLLLDIIVITKTVSFEGAVTDFIIHRTFVVQNACSQRVWSSFTSNVFCCVFSCVWCGVCG